MVIGIGAHWSAENCFIGIEIGETKQNDWMIVFLPVCLLLYIYIYYICFVIVVVWYLSWLHGKAGETALLQIIRLRLSMHLMRAGSWPAELSFALLMKPLLFSILNPWIQSSPLWAGWDCELASSSLSAKPFWYTDVGVHSCHLQNYTNPIVSELYVLNKMFLKQLWARRLHTYYHVGAVY